MEIGEKLKEAREKKGLSLESLQETTKIQKRYLEAIEEGNFQILPGTFYARAFIREYALAVGLNPEELLEEHQNEVPSADNDTVQYTRMQRTSRENRRDRNPVSFSFIPTLIVVLLVIAIFFAGWLFLRKSTSTDHVDPVEEQNEDEIYYNEDGDQKDKNSSENEPANDDQEEENTASEDEKDEEDSEPAKPEFSVVEEGTGNSPESELDLNHLPDDVTVELEATGDSYLEITGESGETYFSGMVTADQSLDDIDISDEANIRFNVGNAPALNIKMNGTDLEYPVDPDTTVHQKILVNLNKESE